MNSTRTKPANKNDGLAGLLNFLSLQRDQSLNFRQQFVGYIDCLIKVVGVSVLTAE